MKANTFGVVTCLWDKLMKLLKEKTKGIQEVTWQELKDLRDGNNLVKGRLYRITDYQCTTIQENTKSAGHQFDIVLLALSNNKLAEEGWAMHHIDDTYFANSNLSAWKVWYCLDNDKSRFAWADDSEDFSIPNTIKVSNKLCIRDVNNDRIYNNNQYYAWNYSLNVEGATMYYTLSENPEINDVTYQWQQDLFSAEADVYIMRQQPQDKRVSAVTSGHEGRAKEAIITYYNGVTHNNLSFKRDTTTNNGVLIDNGITYYTWVQEDNLNSNVYTLSEYPEVGDSLYRFVVLIGLGGGLQQVGEISSYQPPIHYYNGRGVIYRLIDEWGNNIPYDFKNLLIHNDTYNEYLYAIADFTNLNEDPTLNGTKVNSIHVLSNNNNVLKPVAVGGFVNNPLTNIILLNNSSIIGEIDNCVVSNGNPI